TRIFSIGLVFGAVSSRVFDCTSAVAVRCCVAILPYHRPISFHVRCVCALDRSWGGRKLIVIRAAMACSDGIPGSSLIPATPAISQTISLPDDRGAVAAALNQRSS